MKKTIVALSLVLALLCTALPASAAFTDVTDPAQARAASLLEALGVVGGVGGGLYKPYDTMTRAEFCKVALKLAGFSSESLYGSYTLFSDVLHTRWYAPYVNAAVREYKIIEGYGDGTFRPDANIRYSEAVTILLRLLGYERADIGDFWPGDYMNKAAELGLREGLSDSLAASSAIPRGQAAILLVNTLMTATKDGGQLLTGSFTMDDTRALLLGTSATDATLSAGTARICTATGEIRVVAAADTLGAQDVGARGFCVWQKGRLIYFHTDGDSAGTTMSVRGRTDSTLTTEAGTVIAVPSAALLCTGTRAGAFSENWLDLPVGQTATLFYGENGVLAVISTGTAQNIGDATAVYGVDNVVLRSGAAIVRDGVSATAAQLARYDVVSYDSAANTYYVSSEKLTLRYTDAGAVYTDPSWVRVGSLRLAVAPGAGEDFASLSFGSVITVALDVRGRVAAAFPSGTLSVRTPAILDSLSETTCAVTTLSGRTLEGAPSFQGFSRTGTSGASSLYALVGRLVTVAQDARGNYVFAALPYENAGSLSLQSGRVGTRRLAANVRIYEQMGAELPLSPVTLDELQATGLSTAAVLHAGLAADGTVSLLVVENITGAGYTYGLASQRSVVESVTYPGYGEDDSFTVSQQTYTLTLRLSDGTALTHSQTAPGVGLTSREAPAAWYALPGGGYAVTALSRIGQVRTDAFVSSTRVRVGVHTLSLLDGVQVWASGREKYIPLSEAVLNYSTFTLYATRPAEDGGLVCFLIAE